MLPSLLSKDKWSCFVSYSEPANLKLTCMSSRSSRHNLILGLTYYLWKIDRLFTYEENYLLSSWLYASVKFGIFFAVGKVHCDAERATRLQLKITIQIISQFTQDWKWGQYRFVGSQTKNYCSLLQEENTSTVYLVKHPTYSGKFISQIKLLTL